jgi:adenylate cyclase
MSHQSPLRKDLDTAGIRAALTRLVASPRFRARPKIGELLTFIVEEALAGRGGRLKGYTLGTEVFNRSANFDAETDSIVRVSMSRLRRMLDAYYETEGGNDAVRIRLAKGRYMPAFVHVSAAGSGPVSGPRPFLIAVEPLEWIGDEPDALNLAAGLTSELAAALSGFGDHLTAVRAPSASQSSAAIEPSAHFGPIYALRGTVRAHGNEIRITLQLVDQSCGTLAWSGSFGGRLASHCLFEVQEEMSQKIAAQVLDPHGALYHALKRKPAAQLGSYLALFRYHYYQEHFSAETHRRAKDALTQAVAREPEFAEAWALLAGVFAGEALFGFNAEDTRTATMARCLEAAQKAVALDARSVAANYNLAMAHFYRREHGRFLAVAEQSLRLAPRHPNNLAIIGMHLALAEDWERGIPLMDAAVELNPFHPPWYHLVYALDHLHDRRYAEALATLGRFSGINFFPFQINLAVIHGHLGHLPEARRHLHRMLALWPDARYTMRDILDFSFPFGNLAALFAEGLAKAGFATE